MVAYFNALFKIKDLYEEGLIHQADWEPWAKEGGEIFGPYSVSVTGGREYWEGLPQTNELDRHADSLARARSRMKPFVLDVLKDKPDQDM